MNSDSYVAISDATYRTTGEASWDATTRHVREGVYGPTRQAALMAITAPTEDCEAGSTDPERHAP
jgi:hypothetical protein